MRRLAAMIVLTAAGCATDTQVLASSQTPSPQVQVMIEGSLIRPLSLHHEVDAADGCRIGGAPAVHQSTAQGPVEAPGGPPRYQVSVGTGPDQFSLSALPFRTGQTAFDDPANAGLWLTTAGGVWTLPRQADPKVTLHITFAADGQSGTFDATGLVAMKAGAPDFAGARSDIHGRWRC